MAEQPRNFGFGEDETMLRDAARRFFEAHYSSDKLHALVARDSAIDRVNECLWEPQHWQLVTELGWTATCVPEDAGGVGMPCIAAATLAEEVGRAGFPSPLLTTFLATFVLKACGTVAARDVLAGIAAGRATTLATMGPSGRLDPGSTGVTVSNGRLTGTAAFVQEARKSAQFVVSASDGTGVGLYHVDAGEPGLTIEPDHIIDLTRDQATLVFDNCAGIELAPPGAGDAALTSALPAILSIASADMVGAGERLLQMTAEYAKTRTQFDHPLGFFQAVKHPLVNVMLAVDRAKSLTLNAACAVDHDPDRALDYARMAKAEASEMAAFSANRAVQLHGGIGFTWECHVHLWFKRQMHSQVWLGDASLHRAALADALIGRVA